MNDLQALKGMSQLAFELAIQLRPLEEICQQFDIKPADLSQRLRNDKQLQHQIRVCKDEWNSSLSAEDRVRIKAAIMAEDGLLDLWRSYTDPDAGPTIKLAIHQHLSRLGNVQTPPLEAQQGSRFAVTINIPPPGGDPAAQATRLDIDATALPDDAEQADDQITDEAPVLNHPLPVDSCRLTVEEARHQSAAASATSLSGNPLPFAGLTGPATAPEALNRKPSTGNRKPSSNRKPSTGNRKPK